MLLLIIITCNRGSHLLYLSRSCKWERVRSKHLSYLFVQNLDYQGDFKEREKFKRGAQRLSHNHQTSSGEVVEADSLKLFEGTTYHTSFFHTTESALALVCSVRRMGGASPHLHLHCIDINSFWRFLEAPVSAEKRSYGAIGTISRSRVSSHTRPVFRALPVFCLRRGVGSC